MKLAAAPLLPGLLTLSACSAPPAEPLRVEELSEARLDASPETLKHALELLGETPPLLAPWTEAQWQESATDGFWHAHVLAFDPALRQLRRQVLAAAAAKMSAGAPGALVLGANTRELDDIERQAQLSGTIEVLSLLGLGRQGAALDTAEAVAMELRGRFERESYTALFAVDRLRGRLFYVEEQIGELQRVRAEAEFGRRRVEALVEFEVLGPVLAHRMRGQLAAVGETIEELKISARALREELRLRLGLAELPKLSSPMRSSALPSTVSLSDAQLLARVPELQQARLVYALREAELREAVASQWPQLRLGPALTLASDDLLTGGLISLELPWPGSRRGAIEAGVQRRHAAREALVDELRGTRERIARSRAELQAAFERRETLAGPRAEATSRSWSSARARVLARGEKEDITMWLEALEYRVAALRSVYDADARILLADLDLREAQGQAPGLSLSSKGSGVAVGSATQATILEAVEESEWR